MLIRGHGGIYRIRYNYYAIILLYFNVKQLTFDHWHSRMLLYSKTIGLIAKPSCQQTITEQENIQARSQRRGSTLLYLTEMYNPGPTCPGLYIGSLYSAAIWSISHNKHKMIMAGRYVGTRAPPVAEISLKPFIDRRPDDECMSP